MSQEGSHKTFSIWDQFRSFSPPSADSIDTHRDAATHPAIFLLKPHGIHWSSWTAQYRVKAHCSFTPVSSEKHRPQRLGWCSHQVYLKTFICGCLSPTSTERRGKCWGGLFASHVYMWIGPGPDCSWRVGRLKVGRLKRNRKTCRDVMHICCTYWGI